MRGRLRSMAVLAAAVAGACGGGDAGRSPDASNGRDAPSVDDASDAPIAPVTVEVTSQGQPAVGVVVYFLAGDSSVVLDTTTDAGGSASAVMAAGGSVTVIEPTASTARAQGNQLFALTTIEGVAPGDTLHVDVDPAPSESVTFDLVAPADPNAVTYDLFTSCGVADLTPSQAATTGDNPAVSVSLAGCEGNADMLVVTNDRDGHPIDTLWSPGQQVSDGVPITLAGAYTPISQLALAYTNIDSATTSLAADSTLYGPNGRVFETDGPVSTNGSGALLVPDPSSVVGATSAVTTVVDHAFDAEIIEQWGPVGSAYALDLSTAEVPRYLDRGTVDTTAHAVTWTTDGSGHALDAVTVQTFATRADGAFTDSWEWQIAAPGAAAGSVTMPTLPTDVFDFAIGASDTVTIEAIRAGFAPGGYDALRPFIADDDLDSQLLPKPGTSGLAAFATLQPPGPTPPVRRQRQRQRLR